MAKADMFLKLEGKSTGPVKGESNVPEHPDEIEVYGWNWSMSSGSPLGGEGKSLKSALSELQIHKQCDKATTQLMSVMRNNEGVKKAVLSVRKAGVQPPFDYLVITIQNGRITRHQIGTAGADGSPEVQESLSIAFEQIEVKYAKQSEKGAKEAQSTFNAQVHAG